MKRIITLLLSLVLLLGLAAPASAAKARAAVMRLQLTEGSVSVCDAAGVPVTYQKNMRLYSGYTVSTSDDGCAYILLDDTKAVKLDRSTTVQIKKSFRKLQVKLKAGQLIFNVTAPLDSGESLEIRTSTMATGVRGSSGIVSLREVIYVTGHGVVYFGSRAYAVFGGECFQPGLGVYPAGVSSIPSLYLKEVRDDSQLRASIQAEGNYDPDMMIAAIPAAEKREEESRAAAREKALLPPYGGAVDPAFVEEQSGSVSYTVSWVNDGSVLRTDTVPEGDMPAYSGPLPVKDADAQYSYTFTGWTPEIVPASEDTVYTAVFSSETRHYTVTWKDDEGNTIDTSSVPYGELPSHADPFKAGTEKASYAFTGWDQPLSPVVGDTSYSAVFEAVYDFTAIIPQPTENLPYQITFAYKDNTPITAAKEGETFTFYLNGISYCAIRLNGVPLGEENVYFDKKTDSVVCTFVVPKDPVIEIEPD